MPVLFEICSASNGYQVIAERDTIGVNAAHMRGDVVIADEYFRKKFAASGVAVIALPADEATKSLETLSKIIVSMREAGANRQSHLWAVGGGAIQDVASFVASIYMRGIAWTYMPTTLLGMVDSCIGGKSSLNVGKFKNIVGTFHTPRKVLIDAEFTRSLSLEQRVSGLIEAAKICYCRNGDVFDAYMAYDPGPDGDPAAFESIIELSLSAKKWFVEIDEFDRAERLLLNLGHTFGHALEAASDFKLSHGIAVGIGMLCAHELSSGLLGATPGGRAPILKSHVHRLLMRLPELTCLTASMDASGVFDRIVADKKHEAANYRFVIFGVSGAVELTRLQKSADVRKAVIAAIAGTLEKLSC